VIRLLLADDHPIVLDGLEQLFRLEPDCEVVGRSRDGADALRKLRELAPDVLVLDVRMPRGDGLAVLRAMAEEGLPAKVVLLTAEVDDDDLRAAVRLGAQGVVLKEAAPERLLEAVRRVAAGGHWLDSGLVARALAREPDGAPEEPPLTPREREIVAGVARGLRNREIAEQLHITEGTVKLHLHHIYEKVRVKGRLELALLARERWPAEGRR
jgi:two-component system NarL family response regulator/two-component system nitrate/nitrite response regulator NarL